MIGLEQVGLLEQKVKDAVNLIQQLRHENDYLRNRLSDYEVRIQELENLLSGLKASQNQIEEGILNAIADLKSVETVPTQPVEKTENPIHQITYDTPSDTHLLMSEKEVEKESTIEEESEREEETPEEEPGLGIF